ncbi:MAG: hypothetical protein Q4E00_06860 [Actinomyces bowdenii]|nr:hypothetical protein [Actinomyces bowdenii]
MEGLDLACCIGDKGYTGTRINVPYKKPPNGKLTKAQKQSNTSLNKTATSSNEPSHTSNHGKSWPTTTDAH